MGDISDADYRRERADIEAKIAAIQTDDDKVVTSSLLSQAAAARRRV